MNHKNSQAIANIQMLMALRLDEKNRLQKIIANDFESVSNKSIAWARLVELEKEDAIDIKKIERLKAEP